jgi:hypothetical protein
MTVRLPPKDRFDLPEVLEMVKHFGCRREDLFEYLCAGTLQTFACPYRLEPLQEVPIASDEWREWFREPWEFPVYADWIGDQDIGKHETPIPLHIVPRAAVADTHRKLADGAKAATTATVYVRRAELQRFIKWLQNPTKSRPGPRRPGAGRPIQHDYSEVDRLLEALFEEKGVAAFGRPGLVAGYLREAMGKKGLPPESTLRHHIAKWLERRRAANR